MQKKLCSLYQLSPFYIIVTICCLLQVTPFVSRSQNNAEKGLPFITNYTPKTFKTSPQAWSVIEDESGIMYFGVQDYVLEYDGVKWRKIIFKDSTGAPLGSVVRSMTKNNNGTIYYGGFSDLGYLDNDSLGQKRTNSLLKLVPGANRNFLDMWTTYATESGIYFQSREYIFRYDDKARGANEKRMMKVWVPKTKFMYAFYLDGNYYVHQQGLGLYKMTNDSLVLVPGSEFLGKERMQVMLPYKSASGEKQYLIGMFYSGLYLYDGKTFQPFKTEADPVIKTGSILYKGTLLSNGSYVLSTTGKGLVIIDAQGKLLQKINRDVGLQDESIYAVYQDKKGTLWLGLDNGISRVETASPLSRFGLQSGINTGVLFAKRFEGNLFVGTSNGLLEFNNKKGMFNPVPGISLNQVFSLLPDGKEMLIPGDGLYAIKDNKTITIRKSVSGDLTLSGLYISKKYPDILLGGGTSGIAIFTRTSGKNNLNEKGPWVFEGYVPGITDQVWTFSENSDGSIWAGTQAGSVYLVNLSFDEKGIINLQKTKSEKLGVEQGLKNSLGLVYSIKGINYFIGDSTLYTFDDKANRFKADSTFGVFKKAGGSAEFDMTEDQQGRVWIRFGKEIRLAIPKPEGGYRFDSTQLSSISELTIQKIYPESNGIVWVCATDGLIRYDENLEKNTEQSFKTVIRSVSAGKKLLSTIIDRDTKSVSVSYKDNTLRFEYAAPFFEQEEKTNYQTWLEGFEKDWSELGNNYYKEYTNLPAGKYTFYVRAENIYKKISEEAVYSFEILAPWYLTWWAYLLYAIVLVGSIYFIIHRRTQKLKEQHRELEKIVAERTHEISQRVEELGVINTVQDGLVREMDIQGIYNLVGEKIREIFNAQVIDIVTYNKKTNLIEDRYAYKNGDRSLLEPREPQGFRKQLIENKQLILLNKDIEKSFVEYDNKVLIGSLPKSAVFVPMISAGEIVGIISLQDLDKEHAFTEADVSLVTTLANSMSVALESARRFDETNRLLKETEQRTAELAVINSVQDGLAKELDMQGIYDLVGERLGQVFNAQAMIIATLDQETKTEHFNYLMEKGERFSLKPRPYDKLREHLIDTREKIYINDHNETTAAQFDMKVIPGTELPKSILFVPLITGDKVKSYVSLQNIDKKNAFSEADVRLLETLANSMSVALENARLFDETTRLLKETEQRTAELAVINSVQEGLAKELDIQAIYELVGNKIQKVFNAQAVLICTFDHEKGLEYFNYHIEKGEISYPEPRKYDKLRKHLIDTREKIYINDHNETTAAQFDMKVVPGTELPKSLLFVPLITGDKVKSYVSLQNIDKENAFSEADIRLLETLANSMSVALENARLFDETNRLLKETEQRTAELGIINSVQNGLASKLDIQAIYDLVGDKISDVFDTQGIAISYYDRHKNFITHPYYLFRGKRIIELGFELGKGLTSHIIQTGQTLLINEKAIERFKELGAVFASSETEDAAKSWLGVPLISGGKVTGTIRLENYEREFAYNESDVSLLQTLASSMSVALENTSLFDETNRLLKETEHRTAELAVINNVQEGLVKEINMQAIYNLVGNRILELFDTQTLVIRTFDYATGLEHFQYAIEKGVDLKSAPRPFIWANKQLIQNKQPLFINENYAETAKKFGGTGVGKGLPPRSAMFVPMIVGDLVKGSVSLQNVEKEHAFTESDLRLLTTLTNSMGVALENARLFDETSRLLDESKQRANELSTVNNVSQALASQLNIDEIINLVGDQLKDLFKANIVYLALLDKKTNIIDFPYQYGDNMPPMKLGGGLTSKIIRSGEPLLINKDLKEQRAKMGIQLIGVESASYLGAPISVGGENIGVLSVQSTEQENRFNENDLRLLSTIAASVGVALNKAQLFEEVIQAKQIAEEASKAAEKANEAKSAFLSTVSHELRTPLTSVLGFAKIIRKRLVEKIFPIVDTTDPKIEKTISQISENLHVVISEGERLTHLINDVLDLAKIEAGKMDWNKENVQLAEVVERAIAATTALFDQKNLQLIREIDPNLPEITGDHDKLIQVVINLISNSVKFTDKGSITCRLKKKGDEIIVSIIDTGIGIKPEDFGAVFEQFKQVGGDTLTDKPKGTGLGLPICKEIVEHLGGRIWLESEVGKGSSFSFALPYTKSAAVKEKPIHLNELVKQLKEQMLFSKLKIEGKNSSILIVDDDESIRSLLRQELTEAGYLTEEAVNGKDALECIRKSKPDLIILDVMMPEINGFDVAAILKNDPQTMDIPIIVLSIVQDKARGFRIGVDRYLNKPIDTVQLFAEVGALLEQGKSRKKVMVVDEDSFAVKTLTEVLKAKGYHVVESDGKGLVEKAIANQPDIIILNSILTDKSEIVQTLRFEKGLENVLFFIYQ